MKNMQKYTVVVFGIIVAAFTVFSISVYAVGQCGEKSCGYWAGDCKSSERCNVGFIYNACVPDTSCGSAEPLTNYKINIYNASIEQPQPGEHYGGFLINITLNMTEDNLPFQLTIDLIDVNNKKHEAFCFNKTKSQENGYACDYFINPPVTYTQKGNKVLMSPPIPIPLTAGKYYIAIGAWQPGHIGDPSYKYDYKEFQNLQFDVYGQTPKLVSGMNTFVVDWNMVGRSIQDFGGYSVKCEPKIWLFKVTCSFPVIQNGISSPQSGEWKEQSTNYHFSSDDASNKLGLIVYCAP